MGYPCIKKTSASHRGLSSQGQHGFDCLAVVFCWTWGAIANPRGPHLESAGRSQSRFIKARTAIISQLAPSKSALLSSNTFPSEAILVQVIRCMRAWLRCLAVRSLLLRGDAAICGPYIASRCAAGHARRRASGLIGERCWTYPSHAWPCNL